jgi:dTDP-glucose 4,6-dehydratase
MKILVTGGAGFIGSNLIHYLLSEELRESGVRVERIVNLDKLTYAGNLTSLADLNADDRYLFVQGDICDRTLTKSILREYEIEVVMHLAAESHVDRSIDNPEDFIMTNIVGTYRLLEEFRSYLSEAGGMPGSLKGESLLTSNGYAFLHVSTDEVFGSLGALDAAFCETSVYSPNSPYSASKAGSDHIVRSYCHTYGMPMITTHCSNNYGPFQFPEKLLPLMINKLLKGESLPVYGDGTNVRDWLYVEDHCRGLVAALLRGKFGESYVIGGRCERKNIDVVSSLIGLMQELVPERVGKDAAKIVTYVKDRPGHDKRYAVDPSRIESELGWSPQESFDSGLRKTVKWYLDHPHWIEMIENGNYRGERLGGNFS